MLYKSSFQKLSYQVDGLYSVYNLTPKEEESLLSRFSKQTSLGSSYLIYDFINRHIFVELFVHEFWILKKFDIKDDIVKFLKIEISEKDVEHLSTLLQEEQLTLDVDYDIPTNSWTLVKHSKLELLEKIKEKIKNNV